MRIAKNKIRFLVTVWILLFSVSAALSSQGRYVRAEWGVWADLDGDCQNTRQEILIRDSLVPVTFATPRKCRVVTGLWLCPYTGRTLTRATDIDIDHVIPLAYAYDHGGQAWSRAKKIKFANDPFNLLAVEDRINRSKGKKGIDNWQPPRKVFWKIYQRLWRRVSKEYNVVIGYKIKICE